MPQTSIDLLLKSNVPEDAAVIDVGCGDSFFVDYLLEAGYQNIYALDVSGNALVRLQKRLGAKAAKVHWIESDVLDFQPQKGQFAFWHDRASFHFQTAPEAIQQYVDIVSRALSPNGVLALGTFSENGPLKCSGLPITQYSEDSMMALLEKNFRKIDCFCEVHPTPFGTTQNFTFCAFRHS